MNVNACGCVLGKVHQHLHVTKTIFPAWALTKKHIADKPLRYSH